MKEFRYNFVGNYNIKSILRILNNKSNSDWDYWKDRQLKYTVHRETKAIPILIDSRYGYNGEVKGTESKFYKEFKHELDTLKKILTDVYGDGDILAIEIVNLPSNSKVDEHKDGGISLLKNPRIHLVLSTNDDVIFKVDGEEKNMKVGELWEINNTKTHSVINNGNADRIHMIIDFKKIKQSLL